MGDKTERGCSEKMEEIRGIERLEIESARDVNCFVMSPQDIETR